MQVEILIAGAVWVTVFYFINKNQMSRIEELRDDAEDYTINEALVSTAILEQLQSSEIEKPFDKAKFIVEMFKVMKPHTIINRAEESYKGSVYLGVLVITISGILTIWPSSQSFNSGTLLEIKSQLILFGIIFAVVLPLFPLALQNRYNDLKKSYTS